MKFLIAVVNELIRISIISKKLKNLKVYDTIIRIIRDVSMKK